MLEKILEKELERKSYKGLKMGSLVIGDSRFYKMPINRDLDLCNFLYR